MARDAFERLRSGLLVVTLMALGWATAVHAIGGGVISLGWIHASSRSPRNPLFLAVLALAAAWALAPRGRRARSLLASVEALGDSVARLQVMRIARVKVAPVLTVASIACAVVALGLLKGAHVAGGADSYGYVSQAHMWSTGSLRGPVAGTDVLPAGISSDVLLPLGYRFGEDGSALVPVYAPGLPIQMALFERLAGRDAVFWVMPLLAGVAIAATYAIAIRAGGARVGVTAAILLSTSPVMLFQLTHAPMSDLPAMAWWAVALAALLARGRGAALLCGVSVGMAILIRPNLVPLGIVPAGVLLWDALRGTGVARSRWQRLTLFAAGSIPFGITIAIVNTYWYGSPLASGYGDYGLMYGWDHLWPNIVRHARATFATQGPVILLAVVGAWLFRRVDPREESGEAHRVVVVCSLFALTAWFAYALYQPYDAWWMLRFLLPCFPAVFVLLSAAIFRVTRRLPGPWRQLAVAAIVAFALSWSVGFVRTTRTLESQAEWRFATIGRYLADHAPRRSVVLAMHHSGSARYYSDRLTLRFDHIPPSSLDTVVRAARQRGYVAYILLDDWEEADFRRRFSGASALAALDWKPETSVPGAALYAVP